MDVSIIIVNYNTKDLLKKCLSSIFQQTKDILYEVIVSDNGSIDGSLDMLQSLFPHVILVKNNENLGFGAANNRALRIAKGKYVFYLNSDTLLLNNAVKTFFDYWEKHENEKIGALGCILLNENMKRTHSGGCLPTVHSILSYQKKVMNNHRRDYVLRLLHLSWLINIIHFIKNKIIEVDIKAGIIGYITGADLFLKNNEDAVFDEKYFLYYEETDLEYRLSKKGLKCLLIDGPKIIHFSPKLNSKSSISSFSMLHCQISSVRYFVKNLKADPTNLVKTIYLDWNNPAVKTMLQEIGEEKIRLLLLSAMKE